MTENELKLREKIVLTAYAEGNPIKAADYLMELIKHSNISKLYRFRPPYNYEIEAIESSQIYMCKAKYFEDKEDGRCLVDIEELVDDYIDKQKKNNKRWLNIGDDERKMIKEKVFSVSKLTKFDDDIRNMCLIACMTDKQSEYMWSNYAKEKRGICLEYDILDVLEAIKKSNIRLIPIWYVENRSEEERIKFGVEEYREDYPDILMLRKYILSCVTKNRNPYVRESEWRLLNEDGGLLINGNGALFNFAMPKRILLGKNIDYNIEFKDSVYRVANKLCVEIANEGN